MSPTFADFLRTATGGHTPYAYQRLLPGDTAGSTRPTSAAQP